MAYTYKSKKPSFLPQEMKSFFQKRLLELGGVSCVGLGLAFFCCLISHSPEDSSFNTRSGFIVSNLMGETGAYWADFCLQGVGFASYLLPLLLMVWGMRIIVDHHLIHMKWRLVVLPIIVLTISFFLNNFFSVWTVMPTGGVLGFILENRLMAWMGGVVPLWMLALVSGTVGFGLFCLIWGIPKRFWVFAGTAVLAQVVKGGEKLKGYVLKAPQPIESAPTLSEATLSPYVEDEVEEIEPLMPIQTREKELMPKLKSIVTAATINRSGYAVPPVDLLQPEKDSKTPNVPRHLLEENAKRLTEVLQEFGVQGEMTNVYPGPVVTLYEFKPAPGVKSSRVIGLSDDIARSMSSLSARISVIPGYNALGIELPNPVRQTVYMRTLLEDESYKQTAAKLPLILGKNISGEPVIADLGKMPHLLIAGTTGSGKSVSINTMILSLLYHLSPDQCKFIMIDPKMLELSIYDGIPHLLSPVVTDPHKAIMALKWAVREMESRYQAMSKLGVRSIEGYNEKIVEAQTRGETLNRRVQTGFDPETGQPMYEDQVLELKILPFIVVVVDEMADLMLVAGKEIEGAVQRLAQMARAAGIHLIMATQRPSVDVITGTSKANFPTRISFHVTSKIDSRTILGEQGAEQLLGQGDMLYMRPGGRVMRVHGPFVRDQEVERIVQFLKAQGEPEYEPSIASEESGEFGAGGYGSDGSGDMLYDQALAIILSEKKASTSFIQRHLQIGYNRAARIIERMEKEGVVSKPNHVGKREVLAS